MASTRTTFTIDEELAERARQLGINISAAACDGVASAVRAALARSGREAYRRQAYVRARLLTAPLDVVVGR